MSLHYEWTLSLWLRPDTPDAVLTELGWHVGLEPGRPDECTLEGAAPALPEDQERGTSCLPGCEVTSLVQQRPFGNRPLLTGLFLRRYVLDDHMYDVMCTFPEWLARWSSTEGWIGCAREELDLKLWLNFYASGGHAYIATPEQLPQEPPEPLVASAPAFRLRQTAVTAFDDLAGRS